MGRPVKKQESEPSTAERILSQSIELFSRKGFEGVSIREIARAVGINEASIYNHFDGKAALLDAVLSKLDDVMVRPGLEAGDPFVPADGMSLEDSILEGASRFFARAGPDQMAIWRVLMIEQYRNERARNYVRERFLDLPRTRFQALFADLKKRGAIDSRADIDAAAAALAAVFFEFSFLANLAAAWGETDPAASIRLRSEVRLVAQSLGGQSLGAPANH